MGEVRYTSGVYSLCIFCKNMELFNNLRNDNVSYDVVFLISTLHQVIEDIYINSHNDMRKSRELGTNTTLFRLVVHNFSEFVILPVISIDFVLDDSHLFVDVIREGDIDTKTDMTDCRFGYELEYQIDFMFVVVVVTCFDGMGKRYPTCSIDTAIDEELKYIRYLLDVFITQFV